MNEEYVDIVFDGPPSHESGRFVEVENAAGASINFGDWVKRPDGFWVLRISLHPDVEIARFKDALAKAEAERDEAARDLKYWHDTALDMEAAFYEGRKLAFGGDPEPEHVEGDIVQAQRRRGWRSGYAEIERDEAVKRERETDADNAALRACVDKALKLEDLAVAIEQAEYQDHIRSAHKLSNRADELRGEIRVTLVTAHPGAALLARHAEELNLAQKLILAAYISGWREGWEDGPSVRDTMDALWAYIGNHNLDAQLDELTKNRSEAITQRLFDRAMEPMTCGHPVVCQNENASGIYCKWCKSLARHKEEVAALRARVATLENIIRSLPHRRDCKINPGGPIMAVLGDPEPPSLHMRERQGAGGETMTLDQIKKLRADSTVFNEEVARSMGWLRPGHLEVEHQRKERGLAHGNYRNHWLSPEGRLIGGPPDYARNPAADYQCLLWAREHVDASDYTSAVWAVISMRAKAISFDNGLFYFLRHYQPGDYAAALLWTATAGEVKHGNE